MVSFNNLYSVINFHHCCHSCRNNYWFFFGSNIIYQTVISYFERCNFIDWTLSFSKINCFNTKRTTKNNFFMFFCYLECRLMPFVGCASFYKSKKYFPFQIPFLIFNNLFFLVNVISFGS